MSELESMIKEMIEPLSGYLEAITFKAKQDKENFRTLDDNNKELLKRINHLEKMLCMVSTLAVNSTSGLTAVKNKELIETLKGANKLLLEKHGKKG